MRVIRKLSPCRQTSLRELRALAGRIDAGEIMSDVARAVDLRPSVLRGRLKSAGLWKRRPAKPDNWIPPKWHRIWEMWQQGVSDWDIANTFNTSTETIKVTRSLIRKRLGLPPAPYRGPGARCRLLLDLARDGMPIRDIAERMSIKPVSVSSMLCRLRHQRDDQHAPVG